MRPADITPEFIDREISRSRNCFVVVFTIGPADRADEQTVVATRRQHLEYLFKLKAEGKMLLNGPVDDAVLRGISIFDCPTRDDVVRCIEGDPMVRAGYLDFAVHRIRVVPGDGIPNEK